MSLGSQIYTARKAAHMTQSKLAEALGVSTEAVSKWEQDKHTPSPEKKEKLEKLLGLSLYGDDGEPRDGRLFDEEHMSAFLKGKINSIGMPEALHALNYAKDMHKDSPPRKGPGKVPYINHPLTMACHAFAMGIQDDALIAALLLHDVAEDCGVKAMELPFSQEVRELVDLVTKPERPFSEDEYYRAIEADPKACMIKCIDRCNNLSTMAMGFSSEKIKEYIGETERYFSKLLKVIKSNAEYNDASWLLSYQIKSLLAMARRIG